MSRRSQVLKQLLDFRNKRNWKHFHSPQNIVKSIVLEAAEVLEIFQWHNMDTELSPNQKQRLKEELADVYNWLILLAHDLDIDIEKEALNKIKSNQQKYPPEKVRDKAKKYTEL
ncbi:MAG: nucleotide pyrophosphohydrolase [Candidatus Pacebacteria bacterium CG10_big_fil_rev_8_21_14_0_10_56_10]|nr:MAG: nucleotide pyrophosphohydrolase [Candidatus Pacebacteria bacterium CG10_big_fil_rev_8_21_14_0_10_56_10]